VLSEAGRAFAQRAKRILLEIQDTGRVIDEIVSGGSGHVRIGSVTGPAIDRVLPALRNARLTAPKVTSEVIVAPSDILCEHLASGRIDFAIGRMPQGQGRELFNLVDIAAEPVALVVRKGHPLANRTDPRLRDLLDYDWIMPPPDSLLTRAVLARLSHFGQPAPFQRLSTASFLLTFALLQQSNAIAPLALPVAHIFSRAPDSLYQILEVDLGIKVASYGLMTRVDVVLPPAAAQLALAIQSHTPSVD
jgi:DNA-binding transcriptional LysR family regulator